MTSTALLDASREQARLERAEPVFADVGSPRHPRSSIDEVMGLARALDATGDGVNTAESRRRGAGLMLRYLALFPGATWPERWTASGLDRVGAAEFRPAVCDALGVQATRARWWVLSAGAGALMALDVVRPGFEFTLSVRFQNYWRRVPSWRGDPDVAVVDRLRATDQTRSHAAGVLGRLLVLTGRPVASLRAEDLLTYRTDVLARRNQTVGLGHLWLCLADLGTIDGTLYQALRPGQKSVTELVDRYAIENPRVRNLFIAYLTERSLTIDYSTLRSVTIELCRNFWKQVEQLEPGIDTLTLSDELATRWKDTIRWRPAPDGTAVPRRGVMGTYMTVRGFYADLIQLAYDEPGRWAEWASRCPVSENEVKAYRKVKLARRSEMHERTRRRAGRVTELADAAEANYHRARLVLDAARAAGPGDRFTAADRTYTRVDQAADAEAHPRVVPVGPDGSAAGARLDTVIDEEDAFWGFAIVEVLRQTGIRIEEMLELTQLDLHDYEHRDPTVGRVLLLHVNPSKTDRERMVVVAPELAAVLAAMARRVRAAVASTGVALPLLVAYDYAECVNTEALPFLFQRTAGRGIKGATRAMHRAYIYRVLAKITQTANLTAADGSVLDFTPHDFRRIFATDALAAGLPPHIIQKLLGHATLDATQGYAAIFPDDVIRSHRAFIENRRTVRPTDEYRPVTPAEWDEFEEHFAKRKIAIGDCMRAYGTNCVHEYACEQCQLARPDAEAEPRLRRTRVGLLEQLTDAHQRGWAGEIERLDYILAGVNDKLAELDRNHRLVTWIDGPRRKPTAGPSTLRIGSSGPTRPD